MHKYFWQPVDKPKDKFIGNYAFCKNATYIKTNFQIKKGPLQNLRARKSTLSGPHIPVPTFPLSTPPRNITQQDYYGWRCGTLLHSYYTGTYTEVTVLLLWSSCNATLEYPHRYSNRVAVWVLHGNSRVTSQEQHCYFSVGTSAVTV